MNRLLQYEAEWATYRRWMHKVITVYIFETERPLILSASIQETSRRLFANKITPDTAAACLIELLDSPF
jgi:hypothetical protein